MKTAVYNQLGKETGEMTLPKELFEVEMNADLVHQVVVSQNSNKRQGSAHTKNRSEVRGGGRKPWRQKGTGRARHGSTRSPIWVGGGVSGGPRNDKNYDKIVPAKMRKKAMFMILSEKAKNNLVVVMESLELPEAKTKKMAAIIKTLPAYKASRLVSYPASEKSAFRASRNIPRTGVLEARNLNVTDLLQYKYLVISKEGIKELENTFGK